MMTLIQGGMINHEAALPTREIKRVKDELRKDVIIPLSRKTDLESERMLCVAEEAFRRFEERGRLGDALQVLACRYPSETI